MARCSVETSVGFEKWTFFTSPTTQHPDLHLHHLSGYLDMVWCWSNGISTGPGIEAGVRFGVREKVGGESDGYNAFLQTWGSKDPLNRFCWEWVVCFRRNEIWSDLQPGRPWLPGWIWLKCFHGCHLRGSLISGVSQIGEIYPNWLWVQSFLL